MSFSTKRNFSELPGVVACLKDLKIAVKSRGEFLFSVSFSEIDFSDFSDGIWILVTAVKEKCLPGHVVFARHEA